MLQGGRYALVGLPLYAAVVACGAQPATEPLGVSRANVNAAPWVASPDITFPGRPHMGPCGLPHAVASGNDVAAAWIAAGNVEMVRIAPDLTPRDTPPLVLNDATQGDPGNAAIACDGTTCLVVWTSSDGQARGRLVADGQPGTTFALGEVTPSMPPQVVATGSGFVAAWSHAVDSDWALDAALVSNAGEVTKKNLLAGGGRLPVLGFNGTELLLVTYAGGNSLYSGGKAMARRLDLQLGLVDAAGVELGTDPCLQLSSDGAGFALTCGAANQLSFRTVGPDLQLGAVTTLADVNLQTSLVRGTGGYVLFYRRNGSPSIYRVYINNKGSWTTTKLKAESTDTLGAAMLPNAGMLLTCATPGVAVPPTPQGALVRPVTTAGMVNGDPAVYSQRVDVRQSRPRVRASAERYLVTWHNAGLWWGGVQAAAARVSVGGKVLDEPPLQLFTNTGSDVFDAAVSDEAVFVGGFHGLPFSGWPTSAAVSIVPDSGVPTVFDLPGRLSVTRSSNAVLALGWDNSRSEYAPYYDYIRSQRFSLDGQPLDAAPVTLCASTDPAKSCYPPIVTSVGSDFLLFRIADAKPTNLELIHVDGTLEQLPPYQFATPAWSTSSMEILANDSTYAYGVVEGDELTLRPISATGDVGAPNVIPKLAGYQLLQVFPDGDDFRALLTNYEQLLVARIGDGEFTDLEPLPDDPLLMQGRTLIASAKAGAFAAVHTTDDDQVVARLFARALSGGTACEAAWQCASAACEAGHCADGNVDAGGSGGQAAVAAGGEPAVAMPPSATGGTPEGGAPQSGTPEAGASDTAAGRHPPETTGPSDSGGGDPSTPARSAKTTSGCGCRGAGTSPHGATPVLTLLLLAGALRRRWGWKTASAGS